MSDVEGELRPAVMYVLGYRRQRVIVDQQDSKEVHAFVALARHPDAQILASKISEAHRTGKDVQPDDHAQTNQLCAALRDMATSGVIASDGLRELLKVACDERLWLP